MRWTKCGCVVDKMWMMWMCGGQNVDDVDVWWTKCG